MTSEEYYVAPSDEIFEDIKEAAITIWKTYSNEFGYVDEKLARISHVKNIKDNAWYIFAMFDDSNKVKLIRLVKRADTKARLKELMLWNYEEFLDLLTEDD